MPLATTHHAYFAASSGIARSRLELIQAEVERQVPGAVRCIGYQIPAFEAPPGHRRFFYFAAFKRHIGVYPPLTDDAALITETSRWRGPKGNLSFPFGEPLPLALIGRVAKALAAHYSQPGKA